MGVPSLDRIVDIGIVAVTCAVAHDFRSTLGLLQTNRYFVTHMLRDDTFFMLLAKLQWGSQFWYDAMHRQTSRTFKSMRYELWCIDRFQHRLCQHGFPLWKEADFRRMWEFEATCNARAERVGSL